MIQKTAGRIDKLEAKIDSLEEELEEADDVQKGQLRDELKQLRDLQSKLQEEKNILLRQQEALQTGTAGADSIWAPASSLCPQREPPRICSGAVAASSRLYFLRLLGYWSAVGVLG